MTHPIDTSYLALVATQAAMQAGQLLRKGFGSTFEIALKPGNHNFVTEYDHWAESIVLNTIRSHFPDHNILAEESGLSESPCSPYLWIIDPLDGTLNFANHIPQFVVSIGIAYQNEIIAGVIYQPMLNELFTAEKGKGAFMNGRQLSVSSVTKLDQAVVSTGMPFNVREDGNPYLDCFAKFVKQGSAMREIGSAALSLAYLAAGRFSAFWIDSLQPWDMAAGKLIVEEAQGRVTHYDGNHHDIFSTKNLLASNSHLHDSLISILQTYTEQDSKVDLG